MIYLAIISFVVFLIYSVISIAKNEEIPDNLSDTYYLYPKWVFPIVMVFMAFTLLPCWLEITEGETGQFLSFLSCAGLLFVASAPDYKNDKGQYIYPLIGENEFFYYDLNKEVMVLSNEFLYIINKNYSQLNEITIKKYIEYLEKRNPDNKNISKILNYYKK